MEKNVIYFLSLYIDNTLPLAPFFKRSDSSAKTHAKVVISSVMGTKPRTKRGTIRMRIFIVSENRTKKGNRIFSN